MVSTNNCYNAPQIIIKVIVRAHQLANIQVQGDTRIPALRPTDPQTLAEKKAASNGGAIPLAHRNTTGQTVSGENRNSTAPKHEFVWDPWPDGVFHSDVSWQEASHTKRLQTHWAERTHGGDRRGSEDADVWDKGKRSTRACLGVFVCDNNDCKRVTRPMTDPRRLKAQSTSTCRCGAQLVHQECGVRSILWSWSGGIRYQHDGFHYHPRPPVIHPTPDEKERFAALVQQHPKAGALSLIVGAPTLEGPGESVADISPVYTNAHRVSKERQKLRRGAVRFSNGDSFISAFAEFDLKHPGFLVSEVFGSVTVVSFQSPFMLSNLVHDYIQEDRVNGLVNDAAHGWWQESNSLLMISSVYSSDLNCWVPGLLSYTNGATGHHFTHHFLALFETIAIEAERRGIEIADELFAGVSYIFDK